MYKDIVDIDKKRGIIQVTTPDERWYGELDKDDNRIWFPSVTWITSYYPKGFGYEKWLANQGWDEAQRIKNEAGDKGTKVHKAVEILVSGQAVTMKEKFLNKSTGQAEELTADEYEAVMTFANWWKTLTNPKLISSEIAVFNREVVYAGTVDLVIEIDGELWIIDLKTSKSVYPSHRIQISAYKHADGFGENYKLGILQVGYQLNKNKYKFTEVADQFDLFLATKKVWNNETSQREPLQREFPIEIKL